MIENLERRVRERVRHPIIPRLSEITCVASLAHHKLLGSVSGLWLYDVDLTSIPTEHLASLASCVTENYFPGVHEGVHIQNVSGCSLVTILDSVKINRNQLVISKQSLNSEETRALVRAMESNVVKVWLKDQVTLDMRVLMEYNGQGKCREVELYYDTANRYMEQLRTWTKNRNWEVNMEYCNFRVQRLKTSGHSAPTPSLRRGIRPLSATIKCSVM